MKRVGLIGWRGMVGSVLMQRMREERDFDAIDPIFFTTSQVGGKAPKVGKDVAPLNDAHDIKELKAMDIIISAQGGDYTSEIFHVSSQRFFDNVQVDGIKNNHTICFHTQCRGGVDPVTLPACSA